MSKLKQIIRTTIVYVATVVLAGSVPMAAFADDSDPCAGTGHFSKRWVTDPTTGQCVKLYDKDGTYVGPSYMAPAPSTPVPAETPVTPAPSAPAVTDPSTGALSTETAPTAIQDSGNNNTTGLDTTTNASSTTNATTNVDVTNGVQSTAVSGGAEVSGNESKGGATSGSANTDATVINTVHSTIGGDTSGVATFTYDINGNVVGDITLNGANGSASVNNTTNLNASTTANNNVGLNNDVTLTSKSGDASVSGNESGGSATSGDANAVANVLNLINTIIAANKSFVGTINIYGNLDGDILVSPEFIPQLLASNAAINNCIDTSLSASLTDNQQIVNNIKLNATSGEASVSGNESSGSATTGVANTNLTILNLTGHQVNAANSLLVFVNVLGTWVGMIVDAPGATAAALGSGVTSNNTLNVSQDATLTNNVGITNNIDLTAATGNASVSGNESKGSATSGNATASANVANISSTTFNLSDWFGVLFINVFGNWKGSFGVNTEAGTLVPLAGDAIPQPAAELAPSFRFGFVPKQPQTTGATRYQPASFNNSIVSSGSSIENADTPEAQLIRAAVANTATDDTAGNQMLIPGTSPREDPFSVILMASGFTVAGLGALYMLIRRLLGW